MAGIYIHIPFCKQACHYCNFHFSTSLQYKNEFLDALLNEILLRKKEFDQVAIETIYFGGGTPGLLSPAELQRILGSLHQHYDCSAVQETTVEMNPDDVSAERVLGYKKIGVDRISLGVQSFFEEDLAYMNRSHNAAKALESIDVIHDHMQNYTVDLIYGYPLLTDKKLEQNVDQLIEKSVPHISIYGMTVEPKTALASFIQNGKEKSINSEQGSKQFQYLMQRLEQDAYEHYEISSYARKGYRAIHNSNYWAGKAYLGLGPGAHSFAGQTRAWNVANNAQYIKSLAENKLPQECETLSHSDMLNEIVMLGLRVKEGLELAKYQGKSSAKEFKNLLEKSDAHIAHHRLEKTATHLRLTHEGKLFCDGISADLFV